MAKTKRTPSVVRPTGARRLVELGKDLLILALACSAVFLAWQTPIATELRRMMLPPAQTVQFQSRQAGEAVSPYGIGVRGSLGLYGVSYDESLVSQAFNRVSPFLGEALITAGETESASALQWRRLLEAPGIYCVFQGRQPLPVLAAWLGDGAGPEGEAQALLLAYDGTQVWLGWRDGKNFYCAPTALSYEEHLKPVLEEYNPNGAAYAYTMEETDRTYAALDPYVLVSMTTPQPPVYAVTAPDLMGDREALEELLQALDFRSGVGSAYETAGDLAINESGDRLRVNSTGRVVFHAGEEARYPVSAIGEALTVQEAALRAWDLLSRAVDPWTGEGRYVLTGVRAVPEGWEVSFHAQVGGIPVQTGSEGWSAVFLVGEEKILSFTLDLRTYAATGRTGMVTSQRLAAAAMNALPKGGRRLTLCYSDNRSGLMNAGWIAEE